MASGKLPTDIGADYRWLHVDGNARLPIAARKAGSRSVPTHMNRFFIQPPGVRGAGMFGRSEYERVIAFYASLHSSASPLRHLPALASRLGVSELLVKDESARFGLGAFKILGVRYAVAQLLPELDSPETRV